MALATTTLAWLPPNDPPRDDRRVILLLRTGPDSTDWDAGWWDGTSWRLCESGGIPADEVLGYAAPELPISTPGPSGSALERRQAAIESWPSEESRLEQSPETGHFPHDA